MVDSAWNHSETRSVTSLKERVHGGRTINRTFNLEAPLKTMTYSESRANYAETLSLVGDNREEVLITRKGHESVVMMSLRDYESLQETLYLLRSPANAQRLLESISRLESGQGFERDLLE